MTKNAKTTARPKPPKNFDENPPLTDARLRKMRPAAEMVPNIVAEAKRGPGRPKVKNAKVPVSLRLSPDIIAAYKATGQGWQGRMSEALAKGATRLRAKA